MLETLDISDFALISHSEVEFSPGFNVVTGESGAGKSILMAAAALLFGGRADRGAIRTDCEAATVSGSVSVPEYRLAAVKQLLAEADIPLDESRLLLRRKVTKSGVRNFVNDTPVSAKLLSDLGKLLIDFHGANEQLELTIPARQLDLLDRFAGLDQERAAGREAWEKLLAARRRLAEFAENSPDEAELERYRETLQDIDRVNPAPGEEAELSARYQIIANSREVLLLCDQLRETLLDGEMSAVNQLGEAHRQLHDLERLAAGSAESLLAECDELQENAQNLARQVSAIADHVDLDGEALQALESRLESIHTLKRRYHTDEAGLIELAQTARERLAGSADRKKHRRELEKEELQAQEVLRSVAADLTKKRRAAATKLTAAVRDILVEIGFPGCRLEAALGATELSALGGDALELQFSANVGEELRPLHKIASSGELSRLMLALRSVIASADLLPTVVFDEIDMNIGGETANMVGEKLRALGAHCQILCISHLAQVAARADAHYGVVKHTESGRTVSQVRKLADPVPELARMLGGGASALRHAQELFEQVKRG